MSKQGIVILIFGAAAIALFYLFSSRTGSTPYATTATLIPTGSPTTAYPLGTASSPALNQTYVMNPSPVSSAMRQPTASGLPSLITSTLGAGSGVAAASTPYTQPPQVGSASYTYMTTPTAYANVLQNSNTAFTQATLSPTYMQTTGELTIPPDPTIGSLDLQAPAGIPDITDASVAYCTTCS